MNWKDNPNLFANGKFEISHPEYSNDIPFTAYWFREFERNIEDCTLIARRVEDMTYEEVKNQFPNTDRISLSDAVSKEAMFFDDFLYLISIGVYPFSQSHFEDGTVIARDK